MYCIAKNTNLLSCSVPSHTYRSSLFRIHFWFVEFKKTHQFWFSNYHISIYFFENEIVDTFVLYFIHEEVEATPLKIEEVLKLCFSLSSRDWFKKFCTTLFQTKNIIPKFSFREIIWLKVDFPSLNCLKLAKMFEFIQ